MKQQSSFGQADARQRPVAFTANIWPLLICHWTCSLILRRKKHSLRYTSFQTLWYIFTRQGPSASSREQSGSMSYDRLKGGLENRLLMKASSMQGGSFEDFFSGLMGLHALVDDSSEYGILADRYLNATSCVVVVQRRQPRRRETTERNPDRHVEGPVEDEELLSGKCRYAILSSRRRS